MKETTAQNEKILSAAAAIAQFIEQMDKAEKEKKPLAKLAKA